MNFEELMGCYYISEDDNNQIVYGQLLAEMKKRNVTPVIGAGLSCWAFPLWSDMLEAQARNYGLDEEMETLLGRNEYEKAASLLDEEITHNGFIRVLQQIFRTSHIKECAEKCPDYLKMIPSLFQGPIITTNFDRVIEYLFEVMGTGFLDRVIPSDNFQSEKIKSALHENYPILIKMHGDIEDPGHLVLTEESYDITYGKNLDYPDLTHPMPRFLKKVLERNPVLFLGCSLDSDRTCSVIRNCASSYAQFAFLPLPKDTNNKAEPVRPRLRGADKKIMAGLRERRRTVIGDLNLRVIWYPHDMHEEAFAALFKRLSEDLNERNFMTSVSPANRLISRMPQARDVFYGRDTLLEKIHDTFAKGKRVLFLEGIGGIGKSELAKRYVVKYENEYENIQFLTYTSGLKDLICDSEGILIENFKQRPGESGDEFCQRKLQMLQVLADEKTLLIIDNFDVEDDPWLKRFLEGKYRVIFTTRYSHPGYPSLKVDIIKDSEALMSIFSDNYGRLVKDEERPHIEEILRLVGYHTYAVELIAKQMKASYLNAGKMLEILKTGRFSVSETVAGRDGQRTAFEHLCALFKVSSLNSAEKEIMMELSLAGIEGIPVKWFQEWAGLDSFETVNRLIRSSWIRREQLDSEQRFSLHPLVKEVIDHELCPSTENCRGFLERAAEFCSQAWYRDYEEKFQVANNILELLKYFGTSMGKELQIFEPCVAFLWQVGKFEDSIYYSRKLYEACLEEFGEASMETGQTAKTVGGCYFNSGREIEAVEWYETGLRCMQLASKEDNEDLAMSYEKVGRCYTWEENPKRDFAKAKEYFQIALTMRLHLRDMFKSGKKLKTVMKYENYGLALAEERIGENYMEMGRMYFAMKEYENALKYAQLYSEMVPSYNKPGLAYAYYDQGCCHYYLGIKEVERENEEEAIEQWRQAEKFLTKALEINMEKRGALALDTIDNQEYLSDVYLAMSRWLYKRAVAGFVRAKAMAENLTGEDSGRTEAIGEKIRRAGLFSCCGQL